MTIWRHLDGHDAVRNFEHVYLGPGVYVLFDGPARDGNIVYIGKSVRRVMMRVRKHAADKDFTRVGVVLPRKTTDAFIHNLEHYVVQEYFDRYGELPYYNSQFPRLRPRGPKFRWHTIGRRRHDVAFGYTPDALVSEFRTVGDLRRAADDLWDSGLSMEEAFELLAEAVDYVYAPKTLQAYHYSDRHGNTVLPALRDYAFTRPVPGSKSLLS